MSSFLMKKESIATIAVYLDRLFNNGFELTQQSLTNDFQTRTLVEVCNPYLTNLGRYNGYQVTEEAMYKALYSLNLLAVNARYNEDENVIEEFTDFPSWKIAKWVGNRWELPQERYQLFKTLQCFIYQCTEEKAKDTDLYKVLCEILNDLAMKLVCNTQEYAESKWC